MYKSIAAKINIAAASIAAVSGITISNCCCKYGTAHVQVYKQTCVTHCASKNLNILVCWTCATQEIHCWQVIIYELKKLMSNSYCAVLYSQVITYEW